MPHDIKIMTITPGLAEEWLKKNTHNRLVKEHHVNALASDMQSGNWRWNGESIKFSEDGTLLDGQHRLLAIVKSGVPIAMLVIFGVEPDAQHTMDAGARRNAGDMLKLKGEKNYLALAAGTRAAINWERGQKGFKGGASQTVTNSQILEYLGQHPEMREYTNLATRVRKNVNVPSGPLVLAIKLFYEIDASDAEYFFDRLNSGEGHRGDPIFELASTLRDVSDKTKVSRTPSWKMAVVIKAWNKYRSGEEIRVLSYRPGGSNKERFPEPI